MAFGQASGPPATARQVQELLELLRGAGHSDFRDARGPLGFTQRQAAGKFTRDEATALIDQLREAEIEAENAVAERAPVAASPVRLSAQEKLVRSLPDEQLATELRRRGWFVVEP
jgi:hypothetical protein